jgi:GTPase involved in cell partitioning and DNA repair
VLVYDVTNKNSFDNINSWLEDIARHHGYGSSSSSLVNKPSIILVGNKCDMPKKVVATETAQRFAEKNGLQFIEASAKDSSNVETAFVNLVSEILQQTYAPRNLQATPFLATSLTRTRTTARAVRPAGAAALALGPPPASSCRIRPRRRAADRAVGDWRVKNLLARPNHQHPLSL